jgi:hypothetical protein
VSMDGRRGRGVSESSSVVFQDAGGTLRVRERCGLGAAAVTVSGHAGGLRSQVARTDMATTSDARTGRTRLV